LIYIFLYYFCFFFLSLITHYYICILLTKNQKRITKNCFSIFNLFFLDSILDTIYSILFYILRLATYLYHLSLITVFTSCIFSYISFLNSILDTVCIFLLIGQSVNYLISYLLPLEGGGLRWG